MLRVGGGAAIAARENLAVTFQTLDHTLGRFRDRSGERIHALQLEVSAFGEVFADAADQIHAPIVPITLRMRFGPIGCVADRPRSAARRTDTPAWFSGVKDNGARP